MSPAKKPCLNGGSQSASHPMMAISPNENQFLDQPNGNQFALTSCGDQFSATQIPSGSFDLGLAMPMAPNPTSPMAHSHISSESAEGSFVPTYRNVEGGVLNASTQGCPGDSTIHFVEDESLGPKISEVLRRTLKTVVAREFSMQNFSNLTSASCKLSCTQCAHN